MPPITFGKYEINRELGRGAMGVVYEAHDPSRGTDVALKVLAVAAGVSPETRRRRVERFYREARALHDLSHPNVVRVFDEGEFGGRCYFTMELVRGTTLRDRLQFQGPLSLPELVRLLAELCGALDHIHDRGVIHRDIKPENIMLMPDGSAKLMDFGIALVTREAGESAPGGFHGSPAYMSPEQVAGRAVDGRSDVYSLAVTLYEAATGRRAVEGDSIPVVTQKVANEYPPPPVGLPPHLQGALMRALAKDPAHRYDRAGEMSEDVRTGRIPALGFSPIPAPPMAYGPPTYTPPAPVYLGGEPTVMAAAAAPAPPPSGADFPNAEWASPSPVTAPLGLPSPASARPACALHPAMPGAARCGECGQPICYTCLLEIPHRGVVCRACAFGRA